MGHRNKARRPGQAVRRRHAGRPSGERQALGDLRQRCDRPESSRRVRQEHATTRPEHRLHRRRHSHGLLMTSITALRDLAVIEYADVLWAGFVMTIKISAVGIIGSLVVGLTGAAIGELRIPVLRQVVRIYVEAIRNTPLLVQVFTLFFVLPTLGITLSPFVVGCIALVAWGGAYNVENFRAGLGAVAHRYLEGAWALGFSRTRAFLSITVPIGARLSLPGLTNTMISILKNSALMLGIGLAELTFTVQKLSAETFRTVEYSWCWASYISPWFWFSAQSCTSSAVATHWEQVFDERLLVDRPHAKARCLGRPRNHHHRRGLCCDRSRPRGHPGCAALLARGTLEQRSPMGSYALPPVVPWTSGTGNAFHRFLRLPITGT